MEELSASEIEETLTVSPASKPTTRRKKEVVLERTVTGWFRLQHTLAVTCGNALDCIDPRPQGKGNTLMTYEMPDGVKICRYCYCGGYST